MHVARRQIFILVFSTLFLGCANPNDLSTQPSTISPSPTPSPQYAVYQALIESLFLSQAGIERIVIEDHTGVGPSSGGNLEDQLAYIQNGLKGGLDPQTLEDFKKVNTGSQPLEELFVLPVPVVLIDSTTLNGFFESDEDGWKQFYAAYPHTQGVMTLSGVGFNSAGDQALVYVGNQADYLAGRGFYVLLVKQGGQWTIQDSLSAWIS